MEEDDRYYQDDDEELYRPISENRYYNENLDIDQQSPEHFGILCNVQSNPICHGLIEKIETLIKLII